VRFDAEHVVPSSRRRPHLVVLQHIRVDEHPQVRLVTKGRNTAVGFGNPSSSSGLPVVLHEF
jgi:hypothetical protein